jgi:hypothetical protein
MGQYRCPGQEGRFWRPEDVFEVHCPHCQRAVEFFKDEPALRCPGCGQQVRNPKVDLGCAKWCPAAERCLGESPGEADQVESLCGRLISEMQASFGPDQRRIDHALAVLGYAERILAAEGGDPLVVKAAAILHDIGIQEAQRKHGSSAGRFQEIEGPPIARAIMEKLGIEEETIEHVCRIVGSHHSAKDIDSREFRIVWDADWLVNISEEHADMGREKLAELIADVFRTARGRALAEREFLR